MVSDVLIYTQREAFSIYNVLCYLRLPHLRVHLYALQGTFCLKKMIFGACPKLKDFSLYERYSTYMYKASINLYLQQFSSICDSLMPWTVHFLEKDDFFFMKYFKLVHAST